MGIDNEGNYTLPESAVRAYREGYPTFFSSYKKSNFSTNQFAGIEEIEPSGIGRKNYDNPEFAWPLKTHMDQSGRSYTIQRGYMRSLLTDPNVNSSGVANRRVFFQFNPLILQRDVQQSVGTMMPLLQDPAQLVQPVPGTTQFSFQLMFNREHEVNKGYNDPDQLWLKLPNGDKALVSEVGVLADLMMLDSITGQGLSEDMINALVARTKRQYTNYNTIVTNTKEEDKKAGINVEENPEDYRTVDIPYEDDEMSEIFNANIGNSAFLNPLPFRVMFSSLFMVEGVATGVSVSFNKFSKNMVPTQCVVTINMYALYLGFAKKKTFIYDNLIQSAQEDSEASTKDEETQAVIDASIKKIRAQAYKSNSTNVYFKIFDIEKSDVVKEQVKSTKLKDVQISFSLEYKFTHTADGLPLPSSGTTTITLVQGNKTSHSIETKNVPGLTTENDIFKEKLGRDEEGNISADNSTYFPYITFRVIMNVSGKGPSGNTITSQPFVLTTEKNYYWAEGTSRSGVTEFIPGYTTTGTTSNGAR